MAVANVDRWPLVSGKLRTSSRYGAPHDFEDNPSREGGRGRYGQRGNRSGLCLELSGRDQSCSAKQRDNVEQGKRPDAVHKHWMNLVVEAGGGWRAATFALGPCSQQPDIDKCVGARRQQKWTRKRPRDLTRQEGKENARYDASREAK